MVVVHRVVGKVSQDEHDARESVVSEVCRLQFVCVFGIEGEVIFWEEIEHCWWEVECVRSGVFKPFCDCVADVFPGFLVFRGGMQLGGASFCALLKQSLGWA